MALANIYRIVQDLEGNVVTGVLGTVTLSGTATLASLFSDAAGTIPLPNPTTNNAQFGSFSLFLAAGTYDMQFVKAGFTFQAQTNITLRDPAAGVNTITGTANRVLVSPVPGVGAVTLSTPQDLAPDSSVQFAHIGVGTPATSAPIAYADQPAARTALGLGTMATQDASAVAITGGTAVLATLQASTVGIGTAPVGGQALTVGGGLSQFAGHLEAQATISVGEAPVAIRKLNLVHDKNSVYGIAIRGLNDGGAFAEVIFLNTAGGAVGSIVTTATATAYNTTSDVRLKRKIHELLGGVDAIKRLRPVSYVWNSTDEPDIGFLAHELMTVAPNAVQGLPDAVNPDGTIQPQQVDQSKLIPLLTSAIKELLAHVEALTARVTSLETALGV